MPDHSSCSGKVARQSRSTDQWSKVKYAYYDCRRYANLRGMIIRGTQKIWDTHLAAIGMLWARAQGDAILQAYLDAVYVPFWKRELDVEDIAVVERVLSEADAEIDGFREYAAGEGHAENLALQHSAFDDGIFGVPTYEVKNQRFFGREHLPRIRWLLQGEHGPAPDIAYELQPGDKVTPATERSMHVAIAPTEPESYLALEPIFDLADELDVQLTWYSLPASAPPAMPDPDDDSRGARHRRYRARAHALNRERYLAPGLDTKNAAQRIEDRLRQRGVSLEPGAQFHDMSARGFLGTPQFRLGEEIFIGRQHLPLIRARFEAMSAS